jgi:MarR family transcriptional regulator, organic hydroperoxide resistance regulator
LTERFDLGNYLPYLLNRVGFALVERFTADALKSHALSIEMWRVLAALSHNGAQRQIDLVAVTSIDASTISRLVTRLVNAGLVTRSRSRKSNREVVVALSPRGRALVTRLIPIARDLEQTAATGIAGKDMAVVKRALHRMYRNMAGSQRGGRP